MSGRHSARLPQEVEAGDVVLIPASCRQRIANIGAGDLVFLAICTPRFLPGAYEDIDDQTLRPLPFPNAANGPAYHQEKPWQYPT